MRCVSLDRTRSSGSKTGDTRWIKVTSPAGTPPVTGTTRVRRTLDGDRVLVFEVIDGRITYAVGINAQRDLAAVRRLIERRVPVELAALADPAQPLAAMLRR